MKKNNLELSNNYSILKINDLKEIDNVLDELELANTKVILSLFNIEQLNYFNNSNTLNKNNIHLALVCSKQIFQMLNMSNILNSSIMKNISIDDLEITVNFYTFKQINENIINNNIKIAETINYANNDLEIKSKIHEVLYHANTILKNYRKKNVQLDKIKTIANNS